MTMPPGVVQILQPTVQSNVRSARPSMNPSLLVLPSRWETNTHEVQCFQFLLYEPQSPYDSPLSSQAIQSTQSHFKMKLCAITTSAFLLRTGAAECTSFNFTQTRGDISLGFHRYYKTTFATSPFVNCTATTAIVDPANINGDNNTCPLHHYGMGLVVHPEVDLVTVDNTTANNIWAILSQITDIEIDFNTTIVMNYTTTQNSLYIGQAGYYAYAPLMHCWNGTLSECDVGDLEGKQARACGLKWLNAHQKFLPPGEQQYEGYEWFFSSEEGTIGTHDPQPAYADVAGQATFSQSNSQSGTGSSAVSAVRVSRLGLVLGILFTASAGVL
jgi:hypothetical protein